MARLFIVSNRVPAPRGRGARAGGLEVALKGALKGRRAIWFGWSGRVGEPDAPKHTTHDNFDLVTVDLRRNDYREFYSGFANRVLWPVLHYRLDLAEFTRRDLSGYWRVNELYARHIGAMLEPDDLIWVHDYHLIPLAKALRERGHMNKVGFFLHVPFPAPEIMTALPNHDRLIPALCHYDVLGFQTDVDAANFSRYVAQEIGLSWTSGNSFHFQDRTVEVGAFPVGIEAEIMARLARRAVNTSFVRDVLTSLAKRTLIIGVDRLDYSKGLIQRMDAFERFLGNYPDWRGRCTYLQIAPRSRSDIPEYADLDRQVGETAGRINGEFGEANWTPIRYVNKAHSRTALAGLYRAARVGLVTPLRDGMNLVAKEYVAAQDPEDPGVLVLSRFAGAAREMQAALMVNPYDPEGVAAALNRALAMPLAERRSRHRELFKGLAANDSVRWAERFLEELGKPNIAEVPAKLRAIY